MTEPTKIDLGYGDDSTGASVDSTSTTSTSCDETSNKRAMRKLMVACIDSALEELGPLTASVSNVVSSPEQDMAGANSPSTTSSAEDTKSTTASNPYGYGEEQESNPYGYGPSSPPAVCPELQLRARIRRAPRYQRRNSVTKFSLGNALQQVQKEDMEKGCGAALALKDQLKIPSSLNKNNLSPYHQQLWQKLCNPTAGSHEMTGQHSLKRASLSYMQPSLVATTDFVSSKRRRGMF